MAKCSIIKCSGDLLAKGLCRRHYLRQYRYGDPHKVHRPADYVHRGEDSVQFKHGLWNHPLYKVWSNMISRCENPMDRAYKNYGGRGVVVCSRWHDPRLFVEDMGERPVGTFIERLDNNAGYEPGNCIWATRTVQNRNRRCTKLTKEQADDIRLLKAGGMKRQDIADRFGVSLATIKKVVSGAYWR